MPNSNNAIAIFGRKNTDFSLVLKDTLEILEKAKGQGVNMVFTSSFGVEDMVLLDILIKHSFEFALVTLDTLKLHPETHQLMQQVIDSIQQPYFVLKPRNEDIIKWTSEYNDFSAIYENKAARENCCFYRKTKVLNEFFESYRSNGPLGWVTGLRAEQSQSRSELKATQSWTHGLKINPLLNWTFSQVWAYVEENGLKYNSLHDNFMPSIGCEPCTRAISLGEDFRAGRWWWENESHKECGLHVPRP